MPPLLYGTAQENVRLSNSPGSRVGKILPLLAALASFELVSLPGAGKQWGRRRNHTTPRGCSGGKRWTNIARDCTLVMGASILSNCPHTMRGAAPRGRPRGRRSPHNPLRCRPRNQPKRGSRCGIPDLLAGYRSMFGLLATPGRLHVDRIWLHHRDESQTSRALGAQKYTPDSTGGPTLRWKLSCSLLVLYQ